MRVEMDIEQAWHGEPSAVIRARLAAALQEFQVGRQADDTAVVIMHFSGVTAVGGPARGVEKLPASGGSE